MSTTASPGMLPGGLPNGPAALKATKTHVGDVITDAKGQVVYAFTKDSHDTSSCYGQCAAMWTPLLTNGKPKSVGLTGHLGMTRRTNGSEQVTLNGMPLYVFHKDTAAGEAKGQGVNDVWYVVNPEGKMIKKAAS